MKDVADLDIELRELRAEVAELRELRNEMAALRPRVAKRPQRGVQVGEGASSVSRRRMFKLFGRAAAAGAGLALADTALAAGPAGATAVTVGAADGDALQLGGLNTCTNSTWLTATSANAVGILGIANNGTGAVGVQGFSVAGLGLAAGGGRAPLLLAPSGTVGPPSTGNHVPGEFVVDNTGVLFQCVANGIPGTWVRQAPLVTLPSPVRVYDSRAGKPNQAPNLQGTLSFTSAPPSANNRVIRCSKDASSGATVIPAEARTLLLNLTAVAVSGTGALSVYANGATQPATSNLNWTAGGQIVANSVTSACDASQDVRVAIPASAGASANFIVDVFGYYL